MPSMSRRKVRSATWCGATASSAACRSRRATRRAFPNTSAARFPIPERWTYAALRRFHAAATVTMVSTRSLMTELGSRGFRQSRAVDARRRHRSFQARARNRSRPAAATFRQRGTDRGREESRSLPLARPAGHQDRHRPWAAGGRAARPLPGCQVPRADGGHRAGRPSCRGRRLRFPEQDRHLRHRAARSAGVRRAGRGLSGHRAQGRHRRATRRGAQQRSARSLPRRAAAVARGLPCVCARDTWENSARQFLGHASSVFIETPSTIRTGCSRAPAATAAAQRRASRFAIGTAADRRQHRGVAITVAKLAETVCRRDSRADCAAAEARIDASRNRHQPRR